MSPEGAFDDPAAGLDVEAADVGGALDDFEVDAEMGGLFDGFGLVAVAGPGFGDVGVVSRTLVRSWVQAAESWTLAATASREAEVMISFRRTW
ncbi:hypothetical protein [Streptomyces canus]|uniref:hypothetical protein n=1 Tax=Streptomyces canus TaxID=58343 RepID=UPI002E2CF146|nr:hypothetical protein [Streptomyces canus]